MEIHNTDDISHNEFSPHGRVRFHVNESGVIIYHAVGPFNLELLRIFEQLEPQVLKQLKPQITQFQEIVIFEKSCLAPREFFNELSLYLIELKNQSLAPFSSAFVITDSIEGAGIMRKKYEKMYQDAGIHFKLFTTETSAIEWTNSLLKDELA